MVFGIPLAIVLGFLTFISLFTTISLGVAYYHFKKNVFKYHKFFALLTGFLAILHLIFVQLLLSGIVI